MMDETAGFSPASFLTRAELLDHARKPRNRGELSDADVTQEEVNPLCGDVVTMYANISRYPERSEGSQSLSKRDPSSPLAPQDDMVVDRVGFTGTGCIISQAAASMLTEYAKGKSIREIQRMERTHVEGLIGASVSPSRVKCAMLPLITLQKALQHHAVNS